ncbi:unnamed protein product, partial [Musa textilis]
MVFSLHQMNPQDSARISTTSSTPHQSQSYWRVEAAWRIKVRRLNNNKWRA